MKRRLSLALALVVGALAAPACKREPRFKEARVLGGKSVSPEVLNEGHDAYMHYCYACHGEKGDGRGPSAAGMRPAPRDFTTGMFKFAGVAAGELPNDEDLVALVKTGLVGTPMLPWDLSDRERNAIVQYIKTFSERWKTETPGDPVRPEVPDPYGAAASEAEALELGKKLYHLSGAEMGKDGQLKAVLAGCNACHPSYLTTDELSDLSKRVLGKTPELREDPHGPALKESEYQAGTTKLSILAPDFLFHPIKTGTARESLFRTIAAGIGGTAMPTWKPSVKDTDLWALVHYVGHLARLRDTPEGAALKAKLTADRAGTGPKIIP